jgi:uncharacterized protein YndB with AHSA1/START domain/ketosteroid isomerase-like protein
MMNQMNPEATSSPTIEFELDFNVSRERLFNSWINAADLKQWFPAPGYVTSECEVDARPGGQWSMEFRGESGHVYVERGEFREIDPVDRLVLTLTQVDGDHSGPETLVTVLFQDLGTRSRMQFQQSGFESLDHRDGNEQGWLGCFDKLAAVLQRQDANDSAVNAEQEIRDVFNAWFEVSAAKDLDGSMEPIAADVIAYEHEAPLQYHGVDALRPICAAGFEFQKGDFRWDIPDLQIIVRGDMAITWGLNRMRSQEPDKPASEHWSRGTRVFQRIDSKWKMIHQHVSFPFDPSTGAAVMDARP